MNKSKLIEKLEEKYLQQQKNIYIDHLKNKGEKFYEGKTKYTLTQLSLASNEIEKDKLPLQTRILKNVLFKDKKFSRININDNTRFPIYQFLEKLQEESNKYFKDGDKSFSVVEYLAMKYDAQFPSEENGFDKYVYYEGADVFRFLKRDAVSNLQQSFLRRGVINSRYRKEPDFESLSYTITKSRFEYLTELARIFEKNPEDSEIRSFVTSLPNNTWFDGTINLECDTYEEFEKLKEKYIPLPKKFEQKRKNSNEQKIDITEIPF